MSEYFKFNKKLLFVILIGVIGIPLTVILSQQEQDTRQFASEKDQLKSFEKRYENFESIAARHSRKTSKYVEDPKYGLGHCNPQDAPREMDMKSSLTKPTGGWSPC